MEGPGICGANHPFKVLALADGSVTLNATQTLDCPMIGALDTWIREVVQPAAQARFGEPIVRLNSMGSYSCRGINNMSGASLSEHAFANAIDIGGFVLASGRELNIMRGFNGADEQERAFLHEAHAGACSYFTTVLGPGYNVFHYNHFHVDLAMHGSTSRGPRRYCKPIPQSNLPEPPVKDNLPDPPAIEEELDIARAPVPPQGYGAGPATLVASAPPSAMTSAYTPRPSPPRPAPFATGADVAAADAPRSLAAPPRIRQPPAGEPALITFKDVDGEAPAELSRPSRQAVAAAPTRARGGPRPPMAIEPAEPAMADDTIDAEPPLRADRPLDRSRPADTEGTPRDWDLTSTIRR